MLHKPAHSPDRRFSSEAGLAVLIAMIALSLFSLLGLYMTFNATTELRVSDNYESHIEASYAAQAGLNHARELLKGLNLADLLKGPDGDSSTSLTYISSARSYAFRNLVSWATARSLDVTNPSSAVSSLPDDGLMNSGKFGSTNGAILIPLTGVALSVANPYGSGTVTLGRYFVKVTDNNGEASELLGDPLDDPFTDGDGIVIIRSVGVARTIQEGSGGTARANSVAVYEARFKQRSTFDLDAPMVLQGDAPVPANPSYNFFNGNSFEINGGMNNVGIATIDTDLTSGTPIPAQLTGTMAPNQLDNVDGMGLTPSIIDITGTVTADEDQSLLLSQSYLYNFATYTVPQFADSVYNGNQSWSGGSSPYIGYYNYNLAYNSPSQDPKTVIVNGDLNLSGNIDGGGLLVVTGKLTGSGSFNYNGLILVIGKGEIDMSGMNMDVHGGIYTVNVTNTGGVITFGQPKMTISGNSDIIIDSQAIKMAVRLMPASQLGVREVTTSLDP